MVQESSAKYIDTIVALTNLMSLSFQEYMCTVQKVSLWAIKEFINNYYSLIIII